VYEDSNVPRTIDCEVIGLGDEMFVQMVAVDPVQLMVLVVHAYQHSTLLAGKILDFEVPRKYSKCQEPLEILINILQFTFFCKSIKI
jgi:hypothetical protein